MTSVERAISVVMLVKNELRHLERSLPLTLAQEVDAAVDITVIDSGSTDGSVELVSRLAADDGRLRLVQIEPAAFHHARTRNLGAELTTGRYLVYLGGDAIPADRAWLGRLVGPVKDEELTDVVASYGRQVPRPGAGVANICRMTTNYGPESRVKRMTAGLTSKELYFFSSVACCIDRSALEAPLFDADFPVNEDVTLSRRIIDSGRAIAYVADAVVEHSHEYSSGRVLRRYFDHAVVYERLGILGGDLGDVSGGDARRMLAVSRRVLRGRGPVDYLRVGTFLAVAYAGLQLGRHRSRLPRRVRRALTVYGTED
jgi:rhamnosyltransferase